MDGLAFFGAVRDINLDLPFILFTGKGSEKIASEAFSAGVTDYLQKSTEVEQYDCSPPESQTPSKPTIGSSTLHLPL